MSLPSSGRTPPKLVASPPTHLLPSPVTSSAIFNQPRRRIPPVGRPLLHACPPHSILALAVTWSLHSLFNVNRFYLPLAKINGSTDTHAHIINSTHRDCNTSKKLYRWLNSLEGSIIKGFVALMYGTNHSLLYSVISSGDDWITITVTTVLLLK